MGASWKELREVCQRPVRAGNDVAGLLFGDHASLVVTKLFVDLGLSPNYASVGFLVSGLVGAALQIGAGAWAFAGAVALVLYYVLDCVDGEVARWQKVVNVQWGYYDYLFHMIIKPLAFFGVGIGLWIELGASWPLCAAFCAGTATLWRKILIEIPGILFLKDVLRRSLAREADALGSTGDDAGRAHSGAAPAAAATSPAESAPFQLHLDLVTLRAMLTNFDVGLVALTAATAIDLAVGPWNVAGFGDVTVRSVWLAYYAVILPLDFLDYLVTFLRRRHFSNEMTRLLSLAHHFRVESLDQRQR
jgi:hypothetical protein